MQHRLILSTLVCVLALLLWPTPAGADSSQTAGEISAAEVRLPEGERTNAGLLALYRLDSVLANTVNGEAIVFQLEALQVQVDTYQHDPVLSMETGSVGPPLPGYQPDSQVYLDARVGSHPARAGYKFAVVAPDGGAQANIASTCSNVTTTDRQSFDVQWLVAPPVEPLSVDVSQSVQWHACGEGRMTITGRFVVVLFEIDATLTTGNDTVELRSGDDQSGVVPLPPSGPVYATHRRQQYLYVEGGTLTFGMDASPHVVFLQSPSVEPQGTVEFRAADGELQGAAGTQAVRADSLRVAGSVRMSLSSREGRLQSVLVGHLDSAEADGQSIPLSSAVVQSGSAWPWALTGLGLVGAVLAAPVLLHGLRRVRRHRVAVDVQRCRTLLSSLRFAEARAVAQHALLRSPLSAAAHECMAQALEHESLHAEGQRHREAVHRLAREAGDHDLLGENALEAAASAAIMGADEKAVQWLRSMQEARPDLIGEAERMRVLRRFLRQL